MRRNARCPNTAPDPHRFRAASPKWGVASATSDLSAARLGRRRNADRRRVNASSPAPNPRGPDTDSPTPELRAPRATPAACSHRRAEARQYEVHRDSRSSARCRNTAPCVDRPSERQVTRRRNDALSTDRHDRAFKTGAPKHPDPSARGPLSAETPSFAQMNQPAPKRSPSHPAAARLADPPPLRRRVTCPQTELQSDANLVEGGCRNNLIHETADRTFRVCRNSPIQRRRFDHLRAVAETPSRKEPNQNSLTMANTALALPRYPLHLRSPTP